MFLLCQEWSVTLSSQNCGAAHAPVVPSHPSLKPCYSKASSWARLRTRLNDAELIQCHRAACRRARVRNRSDGLHSRRSNVPALPSSS